MAFLQHLKQFEELQAISQNQPIINSRWVLEVGETLARIKQFHFTTFHKWAFCSIKLNVTFIGWKSSNRERHSSIVLSQKRVPLYDASLEEDIIRLVKFRDIVQPRHELYFAQYYHLLLRLHRDKKLCFIRSC